MHDNFYSLDLRYVFEISLFVRVTLPLLVSSLETNSGDLVFVSWTQYVGYNNTRTIYRFLYSSGMCSCRACSTNAQYSTTSLV